MSAGVRVAAFAALLALIFAGGALAGGALNPSTGAHHADGVAQHAGGGHHAPAAAPPSVRGGLRLVMPAPAPARAGGTFAFAIVDRAGAPVRSFDVEQARRMHLVVVREDLSSFQHLHPALGPDGVWKVALRLPAPGVYRAYADFSSGGTRRVLSAELLAPGRYAARPLPPAAATARTDGYDVALRARGRDVLAFTVSRGGQPVAGLQPYLGARGHLVAVRAADLAYAHVHPLAGATAPGEIAFSIAGARPGTHRLFLQFRDGGRVHTAAFTRLLAP